MNRYRRNVYRLIEPLLRSTGPHARALDFGSGDGWFASRVTGDALVGELSCIDVQERERAFVRPVIVPPDAPLPFADGCFDLAYSIDVLHHCVDPLAALSELARVTKRYLVIKDHTHRSMGGRVALSILDELGNRRFGIPSTWRYQRAWEWTEHLASLGWTEVERIHPALCHERLLGRATNALQYVAMFERGARPAAT